MLDDPVMEIIKPVPETTLWLIIELTPTSFCAMSLHLPGGQPATRDDRRRVQEQQVKNPVTNLFLSRTTVTQRYPPPLSFACLLSVATHFWLHSDP